MCMREMYQKVTVPPSSLHGHNCDETDCCEWEMFRRFEGSSSPPSLLQEPPGLSENELGNCDYPETDGDGILFIVTAYILTKSS